MEESAAAAAAAAAVGPAPFLLKTYEMVDDPSTDHILSWTSNLTSFVVWNPPDFSRLLLPAFFKHNNFSSFIRQLNTYGFRKIDSERWEFANDDFVKGKKHLLRNIHRRKPVHSHSHPHGPIPDSERAAFDDEIERLTQERTSLQADVFRSNRLSSAAKLELDNLKLQVVRVEQRQDHLLSILEKAVQNDMFLQQLALKLESMDFSTYNKKRRLPHQLPPNLHRHSCHSGGGAQDEQPCFSSKLSPSYSNAGEEQPENGREEDAGESSHGSCHLNLTLSSLPTPQRTMVENKREPLPAATGSKGRVNDVFWEQFLTEKPGLSEEASSRFRESSEEEQEDKWSTTTSNIRHLTL